MRLPFDGTLTIEDAPRREDADVLAHALEAFNEAAWPAHLPWAPLGVFVRRQGRVVAGLVGDSYAGWLHIRYLWVAEALRDAGLGRALMAAAETRAATRGCHSVAVDTFDFQAPGFYPRLGYAEFARLDYPPRGERVFFRKRLAAP